MISNKQFAAIPDIPGIYLFYNTKKELIYVGKATSLKNRVRSYFASQRSPRPIEKMIHEVAHIKYKQTDSALEAAIIESIYIKKHKPKYNVEGRDNKSWNYIVITKDEYPRVETIRQHEMKTKKQAKDFQYIFGPFPGMNTKATMKILRRMFGFSDCQKKFRTKLRDPSTSASRRSASTPPSSAGRQDDAYRPCLYRQMGQCLGVCTKEISPAQYKQKVIRPLATFLRGQKKRLIGTLERRMKLASKEKKYEEAARLRDQLQRLDRIHDIAMINDSFVRDEGFQLYATHRGLHIAKIEGYDISNLGPTNAVGALVVFQHGNPDKKQYRKFKIKTVEGQSDVDALAEVMTRRLKHTEWPYPDLFLIDGGKPQINTIKKVLKEHDIKIPVVGIAKGSARKKNEFICGSTKRDLVRWVALHKQLLIAVRDEAHRFAVKYQRETRKLKK